MAKIQLKVNDRMAIIGATGSGKTTLVKYLLALPFFNRVLVIDPKHSFRLIGFKKVKSLPLNNNFRAIYRPDSDPDLVAVIREVFKRGNVLIYVDELMTLDQYFPEATAALANVARTGRERGIGLWVAMQRPRWVPREFLSEAENFIVFNTRMKEDRDYLASFLGDEINLKIPMFVFWFVRSDGGLPGQYLYNMTRNVILTLTPAERRF